MLRIRQRMVLVMACGIAGAVGLASSAWADPLVKLETTPIYLSSVAIGSAGGIDLATASDGVTGGALIVPDAVGNATTQIGFAYLNPNTGAEYGPLAIFDAIKAGGNASSPSTSTLEGLSSTNANLQQNAVIGNFDNNYNGTPYYSSWRGVDLTASGPTGGIAVTLISPTYIGDATLRGSIALDDYGDWLNGYLTGLTGWQNGDYAYDGTVQLDSYGDWLTNYLTIAGQQYPGFIPPISAGPIQVSGGPVSLSPVPEPATCGLLVAALLAAGALRFHRRRSAS